MTAARCSVFVFKDGVLGKVGHDVEVDAPVLTFDVTRDPPAVTATFDAARLHVRGAVKDGALDPRALSASDQRDIDESMRGAAVLDARRFPQVTFTSTSVTVQGDRARVQGTLTLKGVARALSFDAVLAAGEATAEIVLDQREFGIKPFSAMFGTLKVKPNVVVRVTAPLPTP